MIWKIVYITILYYGFSVIGIIMYGRALDIGIALIHTGSPYSILIPDRNSQSFGMVYGVNAFNNSLYIATNQSAWLYSFADQTIVPIQGTEGQNWHISTFDSQILLGNNFGTKIITGTVASNIP